VDDVAPARPDDCLGSICALVAARQFGWNLSAYPTGNLVLQPVLLQLLFRLRLVVCARRRPEVTSDR